MSDTAAPVAKTDGKLNTPSVESAGAQQSSAGASFAPPAFSLQANNPVAQHKAVVQKKDPDVVLSGSVGAGSKTPNKVKDLKAVQGKLLSMGFLSAADNEVEGVTLLAGKGEEEKIPAASIPKTIEAIKQYERVVQYNTKPTGVMSANGGSVGLMNAQIDTPDAAGMTAVSTERAALNVTAVIRGDLALTTAVGAGGTNKDTDLTQVQGRLSAMGFLKAADATKESPATLKTTYVDRYKAGTATIDEAHIPKTIAAIKAFQTSKKFNHDFWKTNKFAGESLEGKTWVAGQISEGSLSEYILSHYEKITYGFKDAAGKDQSLTLDNFTKTAYTRDGAGLGAVGTADPSSFTVDEFKAFGINDTEAKALLWVSKNEGKFNALNTYDRAAVSFGFVQFAGGSGGGSFPKMMATLKKDSPAVFQEKFGKYGINVEYTLKDDAINNATIVAIDPATKKVLRGTEAEQYIRSSTQLAATFLSAGNDKEVQKAQVKTAVSEYVIPSRNAKFKKVAKVSYLKYTKDKKQVVLVGKEAVDFSKTKAYTDLPATDKEPLTEFSLEGERISDYLDSEKARVVIIDQCINMGVDGGGPTTMSKGMIAYVIANKQFDKATLKTASETDILAQVKPHAFVPARVQKAIDDSALSG